KDSELFQVEQASSTTQKKRSRNESDVSTSNLLRTTTQDILRHYYDFGKALSKQYDYYRELKYGDLASQALVAKYVRK
ncbi:5487_t:CDS:2, partial [Rhizophagus irregularis]